MIVLGLDSATHTAAIAVVSDGVDRRVLGEARTDPTARNADLLVAIDRVCREAGVTPRALGAVAIGAGPGSFTGLRIGMATAKGIAFAAGCPLWAVSSLHALAWEAPHAGLVIAALDARRGEIYAGAFRHGAPLGAERVLPPAALVEWAAELGPIAAWVGDARPLVAEAERWIETIRTPSGAAVAALALAGARVDVLASGVPSYIRPAEAEVNYPDGVPGALRRR